MAGGELLAEKTQQFWVSGWVVVVVQVEGMDKATTEHQGPKSIGPVAVECLALTTCCLLCEPFPTTESGHRANTVGGCSHVQLIRRHDRLDQTWTSRELRARFAFVSRKNGSELHIAFGFICHKDLFLFVGEKRSAIDERKNAVVIRLIVVFDMGVIMTLSTLQVLPKKDAADITSQNVGFNTSREIKPSR